jgi:hypothetical protein
MRAGGLARSSTTVAVGSARGVSKLGKSLRSVPASPSLAEVFHPVRLRERLRNIRPATPTFEQELEIARRQATKLCAQNRRVLDEVRRLQQRGQTGVREKHRA